MKEYIYALCHYSDGIDSKKYYYVGHTIDPKRRFEEHRRNVNNTAHTEDVYSYIRKECLCQIFEMDILAEITDPTLPFEDFYVVDMIRKGHQLQNMKKGDSRMIALREEAAHMNNLKVKVKSPVDLKIYREGERARLLREKILASSESAPPKGHEFLFNGRLPKKDMSLKKKRDTSVADYQHAEWLKKMNHLFDAGKIDALGNPL